MKNILRAALLLALAGQANAQAYGSGIDGQSVFRVSDTIALNVTGTATTSPKLASETRVIRMSCTNTCHFKRGGASVTATVSDSILFSGATEYFKVNATGPNYISIIRDSTDGKAYIDQMVP